jgi:hypothetical protein
MTVLGGPTAVTRQPNGPDLPTIQFAVSEVD